MTDVKQAAPQVDITYWPREIDGLLATTHDPHQRAMLKNMRRHILLELSGRWREVLVPEYTVEVPRYRVVTPLGAASYEGIDDVSAFYAQIFDSGSGVWTPIEDELVVTNHSVIGEAHLAAFVPGAVLTGGGATGLVDDQWYLNTFRQVYIFEFDAEAKLIGERSYDSGSAEIHEIAEDEVLTFEDAARILAPYLDNPPA